MTPVLGAALAPDGVTFGAFVTERDRVAVWVDGQIHRLVADGDGWYSIFVPGVGEGARYRFVLGDQPVPDPYARWLPDGVHGDAVVVAPRHVWRHGLVARPLREQVVYELHVGTFTP